VGGSRPPRAIEPALPCAVASPRLGLKAERVAWAGHLPGGPPKPPGADATRAAPSPAGSRRPLLVTPQPRAGRGAAELMRPALETHPGTGAPHVV
jgi:hypothetical protein